MPLPSRSATLGALGVLASMLIAAQAVQSAGGRPEPRPGDAHAKRYAMGVEFVEQERYEHALLVFEETARLKPDDPHTLNMLAYTLRKTDQIDRAIETYHEAIALQPDFPQAREYLAEAYVQAAVREYSILLRSPDETQTERGQIRDSLYTAVRQIDAGGVQPQVTQEVSSEDRRKRIEQEKKQMQRKGESRGPW
jgi:tetratricopeptide (TPR) repeat protein